tara:strand:+ start:1038 stop:1337 length:300 start_codon:yes stop_codon:yes gene_type:complete
MKESVFQKRVLDIAREAGWRIQHTRDAKRFPDGKGFPDLVLGKIPDGLIVMELKGTGGRLSPEQVLWLSIFEKAGVVAECFWPTDLENVRRLLYGGRKD